MKAKTAQIIKTLHEKLNVIEHEIDDVLLKTEQGIKLSKLAYNQLKNLIEDKEFKTNAQ